MKKFLFVMLFVAVALSTTGCGQKPLMNQLDNNVYHYDNQFLGFKVDLPKEFEYYQTQMVQGKNNLGQVVSDWNDLEVLEPTNDLRYDKTARSYAVPVTIRVATARKYQSSPGFEVINEGPSRIYAIKFWDKVPSDWQGRWTKELGAQIKQSFQVE